MTKTELINYNILLVQYKQIFKKCHKKISELYKDLKKHGDPSQIKYNEMIFKKQVTNNATAHIVKIRKLLRQNNEVTENRVTEYLDKYDIYNKVLNNRSLGFDENNEPLIDDYAWWKACSYQRFLLYRKMLKLLTNEQKRKLYVTPEGDYYLFITVATMPDDEPTDFPAEDKGFAVVRNLLYLDSNEDDAELITLHDFNTKKHLGIPFYRYIGDLV